MTVFYPVFSVQKKKGLKKINLLLTQDSSAQTARDYKKRKHKLRYAVAKQDYSDVIVFLIGQNFFNETKQMDVGPWCQIFIKILHYAKNKKNI